MDKDRRRAQRRFDTWRVQRNRIRREYESSEWCRDRLALEWKWDGSERWREWEWIEYWTPTRMGRLRWGHNGCGCKMCKPWKWFRKWEREDDFDMQQRDD